LFPPGSKDPSRQFSLDARRLFAADAELEVGPGLATLLDGDRHELTDAGPVNRGEGILLHDFEFRVAGQEAAGVVTRHAERRLREVVGAEAEELGGERNPRLFEFPKTCSMCLCELWIWQ